MAAKVVILLLKSSLSLNFKLQKRLTNMKIFAWYYPTPYSNPKLVISIFSNLFFTSFKFLSFGIVTSSPQNYLWFSVCSLQALLYWLRYYFVKNASSQGNMCGLLQMWFWLPNRERTLVKEVINLAFIYFQTIFFVIIWGRFCDKCFK